MSDYMDFDPDGDDVVSREVIEHNDPITDRSAARRIALQTLYEIDAVSHKTGFVLTHQTVRAPDVRAVRKYLQELVTGTVENREKIDAILQSYAPDFPIDQVAVVDRNILRIALYEMGIGERTPIGVAIDEAIELAKLFGADNTPRFINGVLGTVADNIEEVRAYLSGEQENVPQHEDDRKSNDLPQASD